MTFYCVFNNDLALEIAWIWIGTDKSSVCHKMISVFSFLLPKIHIEMKSGSNYMRQKKQWFLKVIDIRREIRGMDMKILLRVDQPKMMPKKKV